MKKLWLTLLLICCLFLGSSKAYCIGYGIEDVEGESIWMGWTVFESGSKGYAATAQYSEDAYGRYQMDYRYALVDFLKFCMDEEPEQYAHFAPFAAKQKGDKAGLQDRSSGMQTAWVKAYNADPDGFSELQDVFMYQTYYLPAKQAMANHGIDLDEIGDPVVNGTVYSLAVRDGASDTGVRAAWQTYKAGDDIQTWLKNIYETEFSRHPSQENRWNVEQKFAALNGGTTTGILGNLGSLMASDGTVYQDYVKEWINAYPDLSAGFIATGRWSDNNRDWARTLRKAGDFFELYGVKGGQLDFTGATSGGFYIDGISVDASSKEIPENGSSMPIVYYTQGGGSEWAGVPFGGGTIASSGCSITSFSMVASFLKGGVNPEKWIFPSDVVKAIADKYGSYNHFYVPSAGQSWEIFPALADIYGLECEKISSASIIQKLAAGEPVIMSCKGGTEFTKTGHFIVLTGLTEDGYILVNDPSSAHASYSYKKYTQSYLASCGKGWWAFH